MGKWTKTGVRHKTPKWYWIRWQSGEGGEPIPCLIWHFAGQTLASATDERLLLGWPDGQERWSEPIKEPPQ